MRYLGKITDQKDLVTKEYTDTQVATKSTVSIADTGTATQTGEYITVDNTTYKMALNVDNLVIDDGKLCWKVEV